MNIKQHFKHNNNKYNNKVKIPRMKIITKIIICMNKFQLKLINLQVAFKKYKHKLTKLDKFNKNKVQLINKNLSLNNRKRVKLKKYQINYLSNQQKS